MGLINNIIFAPVKSKQISSYSFLYQKVYDEIIDGTLEGTGSEYYTLAPTALSFRSTQPLSEFQEVKVNGETIDPANYTLEEGSTIVKLSIDYLKTLDVGSYEVAIVSENKAVKGGFTIAGPELNGHGFYYNQPYVSDYISYFHSMLALTLREDGLAGAVLTLTGASEECQYTVSGNTLVLVSPSMGELHLIILQDQKQLYCEELQVSLTADYDQNLAAADADFMYLPSGPTQAGGYTVYRHSKSKSLYGPIRTGIYGKATCKLAELMFHEDPYIVSTPIMPDTIKIIGNGCFMNCVNLRRITLPLNPNELEINGYAFANTAIEEIYIPSASYRSAVELRAFENCKNLRKVTIGRNVIIRDEVFYGCENLYTIIYEGTKAEFAASVRGSNWNYGAPATYVQCSDGQVAL